MFTRIYRTISDLESAEAAAAVAFLTSKDAWHLLERHAQRWLTSEAPHPRCPGDHPCCAPVGGDFRRVAV